MIRRIINILIIGIFLVLPTFCYAYDNDIAHPGIAELAAKLYNEKFDPDLTDEEIGWIKQGANDEDFPTRWLNHFWDPVYKTGLTDLMGLPYAKKILDWLRLTSVYPAPMWLVRPQAQFDYALGDRSWPTALLDYAYNRRKASFIELGHAVHLISDMSVPAHTRDSEHIGDPYEGFVKKNWHNLYPQYSYHFIEVTDLASAFNRLAYYSNSNFYSEKTIESEKYPLVSIDSVTNKEINGNYFQIKYRQNVAIYISDISLWKDNFKTTSDPTILNSYAENLIPQAVGYSAGMIKYFIDQAEEKKQEVAKKSLLAKLNDKLNLSVRISRVGILNQALGYLINSGEDVLDLYDTYLAQLESSPLPEKMMTLAGEKMIEINEDVADNQIDPVVLINEEPKISELEIIADIYDKNFERFLDLLPPIKLEQIDNPEENDLLYEFDFPIPPIFIGDAKSDQLPDEEPDVNNDIVDLIPPNQPEILSENEILEEVTNIKIYLSSEDDISEVVYFDLDVHMNNQWLPLGAYTTTSEFSIEILKSGDYLFRARATDQANNQSSYSQLTVTVLPINYQYTYLNGTQEDEIRILNKQGGPYLLQSYEVPIDKILILEPGVVIKGVAESSYIKISGQLIANGQTTDRVVFTSINDQSFNSDRLNTPSLSSEIAQPENWKGLIFSQNSSSTLNFTDIRYAGGDAWVHIAAYMLPDFRQGISVNGGKLIMNNCRMNNNGRQAIEGYNNAEINIYNSEFYGIDQFYPTSHFDGLDNGLVLIDATANVIDSQFSGFGKFPIVVANQSQLVTENIIYENNLFNQIILQPDSVYNIFKAGDDMILQNVNISDSVYPYFQPGKTIYVMGSLYNANYDRIVAGLPDNRITIKLLSEFGGKIEVQNSNLTLAYTDIIRTEPNLLWLINNNLGQPFWLDSIWYAQISKSDFWVKNLARINDVWRDQSMIEVYSGQLQINQSNIISNNLPYQYSIKIKSSGQATISNSVFNLINTDPLMAGLLSDFKICPINNESGGLVEENNTFNNYPVCSFEAEEEEIEDIIIEDE